MEGQTESSSGNEWELSKENVQPLKQGRKMANLTAALAPSSVDQTRIFKEKQEFEAQIRTYDGDDPLDIWYRYIVWTSENFPKGGKDLGNLLERCIRTFQDQERYKDDERYAKVWLRYTDICTDPVEIFEYMHSQQVCSRLALFFESWAQLLESRGNHKKADEVYNLGIQRNAEPLDRLRRQHRAFEMRLAERVSNGLQQVSLEEDSQSARITLGGLKRQGKKGTVGTKRIGSATLSKTGGIGVPLQSSNSKNSGIKIFCDEDPGAQSILPPSTGEWQMPPTQQAIRIENTQKPGKWTEAKMSQRYQASVPLSGIPQKPDFSVHVDDDVFNNPPPTPQHVSQFDKVLSAKKPEKPFVVEALRNKAGNPEDQKTRVMYCKEKIYAGTEEFSFEELRAARIFAKIRVGTYQPPDAGTQPENVRYMYPKKEVYSFDGEFQYEEILAQRYLAHQNRQGPPTNQVPQGYQMPTENLVPQDNQIPTCTRKFLNDDEPCPMEIGSCVKSVAIATRPADIDDESFQATSACHSSLESSARRGLAFGQHCTMPRERIETRNGHFLNVLSRTPDANRSAGDFNNSNLTGPSPTVFTKQALMVVGEMFSGPLESECAQQEMDPTDKDFEAAFSNDCTTRTFPGGFEGLGGFGSGADFAIYDENVANKETKELENVESEETEDKENMPPSGNRLEAIRRPLAGILQPSVGIPTCSLESEEDEDDEIVGKDDWKDANTRPKSYQPAHQPGKTNEVSLADFTHDQTCFASTSFADAAHMASTPFCNGNGRSSLPSIPWSTIRPVNENPALNSDEVECSAAHADASQVGSSFTSPPSKVLSPILEGSQEDSKSTNSSHSSNASSRRGSCSATVFQPIGSEMGTIQEETSICQTHSAPQEVNVDSAVINPFSGEVVDAFLRKITPPLSTYYGFFESGEEMPRIATNTSVCFGKDNIYHVEKLIGSGAFAKVYLARKEDPDFDPDNTETDDESCVVLKVQKISIEWEFYVSRQLHSRMKDRGCSKELHQMFMNPLAAYVYPKSSVLLDRYKPLGTILDMVNKYKVNNKNMEEGVAFFYAIALLRILETLHSCDIIHGDIKPDNFLVLDSDVDTPEGASLKLIDFGRSIDMKLFPAGTTFTTNCYTDDFQCVEMKEGRPWTTQVDTYGVLGTIHCLVFLDYMKVHQDDRGRWKVNKSFKRHWKSIWSTLFDLLLNTPSCDKQPSLRDFREEFERLYQMDEENYIRQRQRHEVLMFL